MTRTELIQRFPNYPVIKEAVEQSEEGGLIPERWNQGPMTTAHYQLLRALRSLVDFIETTLE